MIFYDILIIQKEYFMKKLTCKSFFEKVKKSNGKISVKGESEAVKFGKNLKKDYLDSGKMFMECAEVLDEITDEKKKEMFAAAVMAHAKKLYDTIEQDSDSIVLFFYEYKTMLNIARGTTMALSEGISFEELSEMIDEAYDRKDPRDRYEVAMAKEFYFNNETSKTVGK